MQYQGKWFSFYLDGRFWVFWLRYLQSFYFCVTCGARHALGNSRALENAPLWFVRELAKELRDVKNEKRSSDELEAFADFARAASDELHLRNFRRQREKKDQS